MEQSLTEHHQLTSEKILALTATRISSRNPLIEPDDLKTFIQLRFAQQLDLELFFYLFSEFERDSEYKQLFRKYQVSPRRIALETQYNAACLYLLSSLEGFCMGRQIWASERLRKFILTFHYMEEID